MTLLDTSLATPQAADAVLRIGTITGRAGEWLFVRGGDSGELRALTAPSCLLAPESGDQVLLCESTAAPAAGAQREQAVPTLPCRHYVLAVLARADARQATVQFPGQVRLSTDEGRLHIATRALDLEATERLNVRSTHFGLDAATADLRVGRLAATAQGVLACMGELTLVARTVNSTLGRLVQKVRDSFRTVEQLDDLRAGRARWEVEGHAQLHAKQATVLAEGAVKIDGARIDLG